MKIGLLKFFKTFYQMLSNLRHKMDKLLYKLDQSLMVLVSFIKK